MTGYALAYRQITGQKEQDTILDFLVATNKPYYLPVVAGGPVSDDAIVRFATVVEEVYSSIKAGRFPHNGLVSGPARGAARQFAKERPHGFETNSNEHETAARGASCRAGASR